MFIIVACASAPGWVWRLFSLASIDALACKISPSLGPYECDDLFVHQLVVRHHSSCPSITGTSYQVHAFVIAPAWFPFAVYKVMCLTTVSNLNSQPVHSDGNDCLPSSFGLRRGQHEPHSQRVVYDLGKKLVKSL